ncbi:MAG: VanW family protein, partial [Candidatus Sumerlaeia bacterium]|nr:VanW family protein [Candidatus Sumerlaeia bacterium]
MPRKQKQNSNLIWYISRTDFCFKNNTKWPLKINASVQNNTIYFSLIGTRENASKKIILKPT